MRTNFDPPADPYGFGFFCNNCDQELEKESSAIDAARICVNPACKHSPRYVPFLMIPNDLHYRFVNEEQEDVAIRIRQGDHTYDDLIILRYTDDVAHYGWYIHQTLMEDEYETQPRNFKTLEKTVKDAIGYIEKRNLIEWVTAPFLLEVFLRVNE